MRDDIAEQSYYHSSLCEWRIKYEDTLSRLILVMTTNHEYTNKGHHAKYNGDSAVCFDCTWGLDSEARIRYTK